MRSWIIVAISCLLARGAWGAIAWTTPAGGNAKGTNKVAEDSTTAVTAETLATTGETGGVTFAIVSIDTDTTSANWKFEISTANLQSKASQTFDYETKKKYVVIVTATDTVPDTITGTVTIELSDVDEYDSTFPTTCGYATTDAIESDVVGNFAVCDNDVQDTITYAITAGNGDGYFALDTGTGIMTKSATAFPANVASSYAITITAAGGAKTATATVTVNVGGSQCACPGSSGSSGLSFGIFTIFAAFVLQKI